MQIIVNGLISGSSIALLAVAFQAVYLPTRIFFLGLAGIYSLAPFLSYAILQCGLSWWVALPATVFGCVAVSVGCEWANHSRLTHRGASSSVHLIASLGIYIVLVQIIAMTWGNDPKILRAGIDATTHFGDVVITKSQWITLAAAVFLISGLAFLLTRSDLGLRLRAMADNPVQFALFGYNLDRYRLLAFGLGGLLACISALVTAYDFGFDAQAGLHAVLLAVVAVIIGGRSTFIGPVLGAVLLGLLRAQIGWHWSARWQEAATFALLACCLLFRPHGLLGRKNRLEEAR